MQERIPVSLLTGFLGSGKTTLLNRLLRQPELVDAAIIVNEFGEVGIDHLLVEKGSENAILLDNGCLCCAMMGDLVRTLHDLLIRREVGQVISFKRIVVETTGLADPAPLIHMMMTDAFLRDHLRLDGILATIDSVLGMIQLDQQMEAVKQAAMADRLILTKTDLATSIAEIDRLKARLRKLNPSAPMIEVSEASPAHLLNAGLYNPQSKSLDVQAWLKEEAYKNADHHHEAEHSHSDEHDHYEHDHPHDHRVQSFVLSPSRPIHWERFVEWVDMFTTIHGQGLLRLKGIVAVEGEVAPLVLHAVQHLFHPPVQLPGWPSPDRTSRLVFITRDLEKKIVRQSLEAFGLM